MMFSIFLLVFLPPSVLEELLVLDVEFPMLFKLTGLQEDRSTHCGVLEFTADEGVVYIPYWVSHIKIFNLFVKSFKKCFIYLKN